MKARAPSIRIITADWNFKFTTTEPAIQLQEFRFTHVYYGVTSPSQMWPPGSKMQVHHLSFPYDSTNTPPVLAHTAQCDATETGMCCPTCTGFTYARRAATSPWKYQLGMACAAGDICT